MGKTFISRVVSMFIVPNAFLYIARTKAVLTGSGITLEHYVGPWALYSPV